MRAIARVDNNQAAIVKALRAAGARVLSLARMGDNVPDLLVGYNGVLHLVEIKNRARHIKKGHELSEGQTRFHAEWCEFPIHVVHNEIEACEAVGVEWDVI